LLKKVSLAIAAMAMLCLVAPSLHAQQAAAPAPQMNTGLIKHTLLRKSDVPGSNYVTVMTLTEIAPNSPIPRHTHPRVEIGYVISGHLGPSRPGGRRPAGAASESRRYLLESGRRAAWRQDLRPESQAHRRLRRREG
jgi:hypothetical protein